MSNQLYQRIKQFSGEFMCIVKPWTRVVEFFQLLSSIGFLMQQQETCGHKNLSALYFLTLEIIIIYV